MSSGMAAAGYTSLNIDDCWEAEERTSDGQLTYNTTKFPSGLKAFGDFVHSLNLSFGLYTSSGPYTCQEYPGLCTRACPQLPQRAGSGHSPAGADCVVTSAVQAVGSTRRTTPSSSLRGESTT